MEHTAECLKLQAEAAKERAEYLKGWPKACTTCNGSGAFYHGGSFYEPPSMDLCDDCMYDCPRCGERVAKDTDMWDGFYEEFVNGVIRCPFCDGKFGEQQIPLPYPYDDMCECEYAEYAKSQEDWVDWLEESR